MEIWVNALLCDCIIDSMNFDAFQQMNNQVNGENQTTRARLFAHQLLYDSHKETL